MIEYAWRRAVLLTVAQSPGRGGGEKDAAMGTFEAAKNPAGAIERRKAYALRDIAKAQAEAGETFEAAKETAGAIEDAGVRPTR